ncbi:two-component system chemotaxis response regulator CheY [Beijerinckia sp. GAS462]|nr:MULTISPECIES: response regulator [unclassified Beijerinckia]MDH7794875.1 two-component system chemotaxis response regulator CheY [Beijerinckia sp. GAS462]
MVALVVEDDSSFREVMAFMLRRMGFKRVALASDVEMAWDILTKSRVDIIVSDWNMEPAMGIDLLRSVRADQTLARKPFIMMTANMSLDYWQTAISAGASDFLCKPFNFKQLRDTVLIVLAQEVHPKPGQAITEELPDPPRPRPLQKPHFSPS